MSMPFARSAAWACCSQPAVLLTGCPQPIAYTVQSAFPQLRFANMLRLQPIPGGANHALLT